MRSIVSVVLALSIAVTPSPAVLASTCALSKHLIETVKIKEDKVEAFVKRISSDQKAMELLRKMEAIDSAPGRMRRVGRWLNRALGVGRRTLSDDQIISMMNLLVREDMNRLYEDANAGRIRNLKPEQKGAMLIDLGAEWSDLAMTSAWARYRVWLRRLDVPAALRYLRFSYLQRNQIVNNMPMGLYFEGYSKFGVYNFHGFSTVKPLRRLAQIYLEAGRGGPVSAGLMERQKVIDQEIIQIEKNTIGKRVFHSERRRFEKRQNAILIRLLTEDRAKWEKIIKEEIAKGPPAYAAWLKHVALPQATSFAFQIAGFFLVAFLVKSGVKAVFVSEVDNPDPKPEDVHPLLPKEERPPTDAEMDGIFEGGVEADDRGFLDIYRGLKKRRDATEAGLERTLSGA